MQFRINVPDDASTDEMVEYLEEVTRQVKEGNEWGHHDAETNWETD